MRNLQVERNTTQQRDHYLLSIRDRLSRGLTSATMAWEAWTIRFLPHDQKEI